MTTEPGRKRRPRKVDLTPEVWEGVYRQFKVPLFIEDVKEVLAALAEIRARGVSDFSEWLDAHPEFIMRIIGMVKIIDVNEFAVEWSGARNRKELLSSLGRMVLPETLPAFKSLLVALYQGRRFHTGEGQYRTLDGRLTFTWNESLLPQPGDDPPLLIIATVDITAMKQAERELRSRSERYSRLVEAAQDVILCHDLEGRINFINQAGVDLVGWSRDQIDGRDVGDLLPESGPGGSRRRSLAHLGRARGRTLYETTLITRDHREVPVEVNATVIPGNEGPDGAPLLMAMIRDITDRKEAERRQQDLENILKNTQRLESLGVLAGGIAHDFNNLLVTIMGNAELLMSGRYSPEEVTETMAMIMEASTQAADLCRQMQTYAGQTLARVASEDLNSIVDNMSRLLQVTVSGRAHIGFQLPGDLPRVGVDAGQIRQVIMNLVTNAVESLGEDGGEIVVRTGHREFTAADLRRSQHTSLLTPGSYVYCQVSDSGGGIRSEDVPRVFDPFFTTRGGKRGLGLSSALGIIQSHNGGFLVESQPGKGTTFAFLLPEQSEVRPQRAAAPRRKKEPDNLHLNLAGRTVLAVDEDAAVRAVGEGFLRRLGCRVLSAGTGLDAVRIFSDRHGEIDAVLLDLGMEGMDGVETCRRLRVIRPDLPVVFSSGSSGEEIQQRAGEVGHFSFVHKPFRLAQIRAIMAEAMGPGKAD